MSLAKRWRQAARRYLAHPGVQPAFRALYRVALAGMNYGGAASEATAGDDVALRALRDRALARPVVFDIGANEGGYLVRVLDLLPDARTFSFEPSRAAFARLSQGFGARANVTLVNKGVGAAPGSATLWANVPGSVLATTFSSELSADQAGEPIELVSLDAFCLAENIAQIDLLKIDVEGGELDVLRGARSLLNAGAISSIQFEFGQPSLGSRTYLHDLFELLSPRYTLYRILPRGLAPLTSYHETLEVFMSTNYLALKE